ncbi:MerR family transcriptional regulator [Nocardia suismassiliense]|uniref:MerR family transcriptional regulator n=1 Tax=Nocardia suismassiliense TaxID=2077092 RepID=A0ABW6QZY8_9NOCA
MLVYAVRAQCVVGVTKGVTVVGWSTRELAELAGTSLRTVRHYHDVGLLDEPERRANGYKSYGVAHLVRVLRIKRLSGLGISLAQIAEMDNLDEHPQEALRTLDAELAETIDRLQRIRAEVARILDHQESTDLPPEFAAVQRADMSDADRSLTFVLSRVIGPAGRQAVARMLEDPEVSAFSTEFDNLPADADEQQREDVAQRMIQGGRKLYAAHPRVLTWFDDAPRGTSFAASTTAEAVLEVYNAAQLDVLARVGREISPPS